MFWKEKLYLELRKTDFVKIFPKSSQSVNHTMEAVEKKYKDLTRKSEGIAKTILSYQNFWTKVPKKFFMQIFVVNSKTWLTIIDSLAWIEERMCRKRE